MKETTGVLVVHGMGAQDRGDMLSKVLNGLRRVEPESVPNDIQDGVRVTIGGQPVRFYEVYWADLLKGARTRGTFQMKELQSISWFPWFNFRRGNYSRRGYSIFKLAWWWVVLPIVNFLILFAYYGAGVFAEIFWDDDGEHHEAKDDSPTQRVIRKATGRSIKRTKVDAMLDEYMGDVFSYVNSAGKAFYRDEGEPPVPPEIERVYPQIMQRFYDQLAKGEADGCTTIQVVAHSLGTVVMFHALSGLTLQQGEPADGALHAAAAKVRHIYTLGCPLEKIRFFWPRLIPSGGPLGAMRIPWDNFVSWFDPVAGKLKRFGEWGEISNPRLLGGGFFRGHVVYERSPVFLNAFTRGLCGREIQFQRTAKERRKDALLLIGETLFAPVAIGVPLIVGAALFAVAAILVPWGLSWILRLFLAQETWSTIVTIGYRIFLGMFVLVFLLAPWIRANKVHALHWVSRSSAG